MKASKMRFTQKEKSSKFKKNSFFLEILFYNIVSKISFYQLQNSTLSVNLIFNNKPLRFKILFYHYLNFYKMINLLVIIVNILSLVYYNDS